MGKHELYDDPSNVAAEQGEVSVDGPDGVAVSLTPEAAVETGGRLIDAAPKLQDSAWRRDRPNRTRREQAISPRARNGISFGCPR